MFENLLDHKKSIFSGLDILFSLDEKDLVSLLTNAEDPTHHLLLPNQDIYGYSDVVYSGCSETRGHYLDFDPEIANLGKNIWGTIVANSLGLSWKNLASGGYSCAYIVQTLLDNFSKSGNPKKVLCLFPDLNRLTLAFDPDIFTPKNKQIPHNLVANISINSSDITGTFSKKPHVAEDVLPRISSVWLGIRSILMLEQYCKSSGIELIYSTWSPQTHLIISELNNYCVNNNLDLSFPGYIDTGCFWTDGLDVNYAGCHREVEENNPKTFYHGTDGPSGHMGVHKHAHIAEEFIKKLIK